MPYIDLPQEPGAFPETSVFPGPYASTKSPPLGSWKVMANGRVYTLTIAEERDGVVTADLSSGDIPLASWDAATGCLTFTRVVPDTVEQEWAGYLMAASPEDPKWRMAGTLRSVRSLNQYNVPLTTAGWYATLNR
ncbi:MAG: hypothetical protein KC636_06940 [Myxococcales bacterium]|nr:hypothetical protein [Myxococcales bacterium]